MGLKDAIDRLLGIDQISSPILCNQMDPTKDGIEISDAENLSETENSITLDHLLAHI